MLVRPCQAGNEIVRGMTHAGLQGREVPITGTDHPQGGQR